MTDARRRKRGDERMLKAFRERKHDRDQYLDAVLNISAVPPTWEVDLGESGRYKVFPASRMAGRFIYEQAVERLLNSPDTMRMTLSAGSRDLVPIAWDPSLEEALRQFLSVRTKLFSDIIVEARKRIAALRGGAETGVPLFLLPMHRLSQTIADYLCAWQDAVALSLERKPYGTLHDALLQLDTLRIMDAHVRIERVVVLPTHPWLLNALLRFQTLMSQNFEAKDPPALQRHHARPRHLAHRRRELRRQAVDVGRPHAHVHHVAALIRRLQPHARAVGQIARRVLVHAHRHQLDRQRAVARAHVGRITARRRGHQPRAGPPQKQVMSSVFG
mgnify:CR=1 FL=1